MASSLPPHPEDLVDAIELDPIGALALLADLAASGLGPVAAGAPVSLLLDLPARAMAAPPRFSSRGDERRIALSRLSSSLWTLREEADACLESLLLASLGGSPERPSEIAAVFSSISPAASLPTRHSAERWIEAGLLGFASARAMARFDALFLGVFDSELGARAFSRFLPNGPGRGYPGRLSSDETDATVIDAMIECGAFRRLAPAYQLADAQGFLRGLTQRMERDESRQREGWPALVCRDSAYVEILDWAHQRVVSGQDFLFASGPYRQPDFANKLASLVSSRSLPSLQAQEIAQSLSDAIGSDAPRASRRAAL